MKQKKTFTKKQNKNKTNNNNNKKKTKPKTCSHGMRKTSLLFIASCSCNDSYAPFTNHARTVCISFIYSFKNLWACKITLEQWVTAHCSTNSHLYSGTEKIDIDTRTSRWLNSFLFGSWCQPALLEAFCISELWV